MENTIETKLIFTELPANKMKGFHIEFMTGSVGSGKNKREVRLTCGAGCGSDRIWFDYEGKTYSAGVTDVLQQLVNKIDSDKKKSNPKKKK